MALRFRDRSEGMFRVMLRRLDKVLTWFEEWTLFLTVFLAMVFLFVNVVTRYAVTYTMSWPEEMVRQVIMYTTFIGCSVAVRNRALIRIDALPRVDIREKFEEGYEPPDGIVVRVRAVDPGGVPLPGIRVLADRTGEMTGFPAFVSGKTGADGSVELAVTEEGGITCSPASAWGDRRTGSGTGSTVGQQTTRWKYPAGCREP